MGYPMNYRRVIARNNLQGDYDPTQKELGLIRGDLRRLERDQVDDYHLEAYSKAVGISKEEVKQVLAIFFDGGPFSRLNLSKNVDE